MAMIIREAMTQDYDALCELIDQADALHQDHLPYIFQKAKGPARDRDFILGLIEDENVGLFVAEVEGQLVGFAHVRVRDSPDIPILLPRRFAVLEGLAVRENSRRAGIGRALMEKVHEWAASKGATAIELNVHEFNQGAVAFYQALGYEVSSRKMSRFLK